MRPFTFAPRQRCPRSVCTWYAKSSGVAPRGRSTTSPFGVSAYTRSSNSSARMRSRKSRSVSGGFLRLEQPAHPFDLAFVLRVSRAAFLVLPVRGHAELGVLVHLARADLHLDAAPLRPDHGGVDRAIEVALGRGDVVVELAGNVRPQPVHRRPAPHSNPARTPRRCAPRARRTPPRTRAACAASSDRCCRCASGGRTPRPSRRPCAISARRVAQTSSMYRSRSARRSFSAAAMCRYSSRLEIAEGEVLQLPLELPHAEPVRERREHRARLHCEPLALVRRQVPRMTQPHELLARVRASTRRGSLTTASSILRTVSAWRASSPCAGDQSRGRPMSPIRCRSDAISAGPAAAMLRELLRRQTVAARAAGRSSSAFASSAFSVSAPMTSAASRCGAELPCATGLACSNSGSRARRAMEARISGGQSCAVSTENRSFGSRKRGARGPCRVGVCGYHTRLIFPAIHGRP